MNKRKVYQPPEGQIFKLEANNHLLETQSYPGVLEVSDDGFASLPDRGYWEEDL